MRKKYNREEILEVGEALLRRHGYHNSGINEILQACGIPKGSFYNFFASKEDFAIQAINSYGRRNVAYFQQYADDNERSAMERLQELYQMIVDSHISEACQYGCLIGNLSQELAGGSEAMAEVTRLNRNEWVKPLAQMVSQGQEQGEIRQDFAAEELAAYILMNFDGALLQMKSERNGNALQRFMQLTFTFLQS